MSAQVVVGGGRRPVELHRMPRKSVRAAVLLVALLAISIAVNAVIILAAGGR